MTKTYHRTRNGETIWVSADFAQASSPIYAAFSMRGSKPEEHEWQSVPFQVADARHDPLKAISLVRSYWR